MSANYWQGRCVRLRANEPEDWENIWRQNQDELTWRNLEYIHFPQSRAAARRWAEEAATQEPKGDNFQFAIETLAGEPVGGLGLHHCDPVAGTFSYGLAITREHQRRGYASDAIRLVLRYFFEERRYHKAMVNIYSFNEASLRLHEHLGFQREGCLRQMIFTQGHYFDIIVFGLLANEYVAQRDGGTPPAAS